MLLCWYIISACSNSLKSPPCKSPCNHLPRSSREASCLTFNSKHERRKNQPLSTPRIRTNNHTIPNLQILPNPPQRTRLRIQIIHRNIKEPLNLTSMQIHRNNMITPGRLQHIRNQLRTDRRPTLIFFILTRIGEVWDDGCDASR